MQDLGAQRGELQHFLEGHGLHAPRLGHHARVGGVDPVDVGVDLALVRLQRRGQSHGRRVRAAPAQGRDVAVGIDALKARHDHDLARLEVGQDRLRVDAVDEGLRVRRVGVNADLPAHAAARLQALGLQRHGQQPDRHLLARGDHHVVLARVGKLLHLLGQGHQLVGLAAHGRNHDHDVIALALALGHAPGDIFDAFDGTDRGAAVLLHDESHSLLSCRAKAAAQRASKRGPRVN